MRTMKKVGELLFVCCLFETVQSQLPEDPDTVPKLEVSKYTGRWYMTYTNSLFIARVLGDAICVTADYGVYNETTLTVYNANREGAPDGPLRDIGGYAYRTEEPGKLWVNLIGGSGLAPYWVIKLGPEVGSSNQYDYAIISGPGRVSLFVNARDPTEFKQKYDQEVLQWLEDNGFDSILNEPIAMDHPSNCQYAPRPNNTLPQEH